MIKLLGLAIALVGLLQVLAGHGMTLQGFVILGVGVIILVKG